MNRRFFVWDPVALEIEGEVPALAHAPLHPTADRGFRDIPAGNRVFICKSDLEAFKVGDNIRLKDLCNVEITAWNGESTVSGQGYGQEDQDHSLGAR